MEVFLIAFGLSMDSVALSIANGAKYPNLKFLIALKIAFVYAFFQGLMCVLGYILGIGFAKFISEIDHFIAFFILLFLGGKMIKEANDEKVVSLTNKELVFGGVATSIDAMAIGVTFGLSYVSLSYSTFVIFTLCFILCLLACFIGKKVGEYLESKAMILGGVILIFIGTRILLTHLGFL